MTILFANIMSIVFSIWCYLLYGYGDFALRAHIMYYMSVTVIGIIICLIHLPAAAWSITCMIGLPFILFFILTGEPIFVAIAINFTLVLIVMVLVTLSYYRAFSEVVLAKETLELQHRKTHKLNEQNEVLANQDGLTKLANRRSFASYLNDKLENNNNSEPFLVALIDLDGFKPVNDIHGHSAGDRVLEEVSIRLQNLVGESGFLARVGGDEFALVLNYHLGEKEISVLGKSITRAVEKPFKMRTGVVKISCSCGFAVYPTAGEEADVLMDRADFALYQAKSMSRGSTIIFSDSHEKLIRDKSEVELALSNDFLNTGMQLHYQPIVNGATGEILGFEALARWFHPQLGNISPDIFINIAEKTGAITKITLTLFEKAAQELRSWPEHMFLSFNLSVHDISNPQTLNELTSILARQKLSCKRVQLEITETAMMNDFRQSADTISQLQKKGFKIAIDDFGSGYSSLNYIHNLDFDTLKIDRSFVSDLLDSERSQGVVKTMLALCDGLNVKSTVEGVESKEQKDLLLSLGCNHMQGYYFYRPGPIEQFDFKSEP